MTPASAKGWLQSLTGWPLMLALLAASLALGDTPALMALEAAMRSHHVMLLTLTGALALIGFIVFFIGAFLLVLDGDAAVSQGGQTDTQGRGLAGLRRVPAALRGRAYWFSGTASTVQAQDTFSLSELKHPGTNRWRDPVARRRALAVACGVMMVFGGFACAFVAVPRTLKPLIGIFLLYALVRLSWGYYKAR